MPWHTLLHREDLGKKDTLQKDTRQKPAHLSYIYEKKILRRRVRSPEIGWDSRRTKIQTPSTGHWHSGEGKKSQDGPAQGQCEAGQRRERERHTVWTIMCLKEKDNWCRLALIKLHRFRCLKNCILILTSVSFFSLICWSPMFSLSLHVHVNQ